VAGRPGRVSRHHDRWRLFVDSGDRRGAKTLSPLFISKVNTASKSRWSGMSWPAAALGADAGVVDLVLSIAVAVTTVASGLTYLVRWARILGCSEQAL
jgi:hypothetical protein